MRILFFEPEDQAINALRGEIKDIAEKITVGRFERTPGWECKYCDYGCLCDDQT
jgi:hypothetical protein